VGKGDDSGGGGMRGSDADDRPVEERKFTKKVDISTRTSIDEAALTRSEAVRIEAQEAAARLGLDASTRALNSALDRLDKKDQQLADANATIARLLTEAAQAQGKKQKTKVAKLKAKVKLHAIDQRTVVIKHAITQLAPSAMHFAPKLALLADKYLPTVLAAAKGGDSTPAAAAIRLFVLLNDPDPESDGAQLLAALRVNAGAADWALIQQGLAEIAASSPMALAAMSQRSYVAAEGASGANGASHAGGN
jgi:hypothetical protein